MKKQGTRIISLFIILMLFIGFVPETCLPQLFTLKAHAEETPAAFSLEESPLGKEVQDGQWRFALREEDGYAVVAGYDGKETVISVPESLGGYDVVGIASKALTERTQVTLPGTVYYLAEDAFGDATPEIIAPNGSYALWWASTHGFIYRTGRDYELVPGVIDYTDAPSWRVSKRGESNVAFDTLTAMPLKVGSLFLMRDRRGMEFFFRVTELFPGDGGIIASVEVPEVSEVFVNYETTVEVALTRDDFVPGDGVTVERNNFQTRSVSSGSDTKVTPISATISGKTKGGMKWSGSAGVNATETVAYTVTIIEGEIIHTELTKTQSNEYFVEVSCSGSTKVFGEINKARSIAEKKAKGEQITEEEYSFLDDFQFGYGFDKFNDTTLSLSDLDEFDDVLESYECALESSSHIDHSSKLGEFRLQTPYFNVSIRADFVFSVSGTLNYSFSDSTVTKQHYDSASEEWVIDDSYSSVFSGDTTHTLTASIKGSFAFTIELSVGAGVFSDLSAELEIGIEAKAEKAIVLNRRHFNNCTEVTFSPYVSLNAYAGIWVGKSSGGKYRIYTNKWTAQDLLGKEYLWKAHVNAVLSPVVHYPEDCPLKDAFIIHYETRGGLTVKDREVFPGGALTDAYNPNLNEDPHVSAADWTAGSFFGWAWNPSDTIPTAAAVGEAFQSPVDGSTPYIPTDDCTVYDVWANTATVSFDSNGGSAVDPQLVPVGSHALRPENPTKEDQRLLGWKTQDGQAWNFTRDAVTADMTLTAVWEDGDEESGGTAGSWYLGSYDDVSDDCKFDPNRAGQSAAIYFEYEEIVIAGDTKAIRITGIKNNPVHLVIPKRLPSLSNENATLEVIDVSTNAFRNNTSLRSVYFLTDDEKRLTTSGMFEGCTNLEYVEAPALENGSIGNNMFSGCSCLKCVKFQAGVKSIGESSFSGTGIISLSIPYGISSIPCNAFSGCVNLHTIELDGVESIDYCAFRDCTALENLYIPDSVKELGTYSGFGVSRVFYSPFYNCTGLKTISVGGVETLGAEVLYTGSRILEKLTIRGTIKNIGDSAFSHESYYCNDFGDESDHPVVLIIEEGVETIGQDAFYGCKAFTSVSIPSTVRMINSSAFYGCTGLKTLSFAYPIELIADSAFCNCTNLEIADLRNVDIVGSNAFSGCVNLHTIELDGVESIDYCAFRDCTALENLYIPDSVKELGTYSGFGVSRVFYSPFYNCTGLKTISVGGVETLGAEVLYTGSRMLEKLTIRGTIKNIGDSAFSHRPYYYYCNDFGYESDHPVVLIIEEGVETIGQDAFYGCEAFTSVSIPSTVKMINSSAFYGCTGLRDVKIASKGQPFAPDAFSGCGSLTIYIGGEENVALESYCEKHGIPYNYLLEPHSLRLILNNGEDDIVRSLCWAEPLALPTLVADDLAFGGWFYDAALTERCILETMPQRDLTLYAAWCDVSQSAVFRKDGDHVTLLSYIKIKEDRVVSLPETVDGLPLTTIASGAFADSGVIELYIPASVTDIAVDAFAGSSLRSFYVSAENNVYCSKNSTILSKDGATLLFFPPASKYHLTVPASVSRIASRAFDGCQLSSITLNKGLLEIGERAFRGTILTELTLPESIQTIGARAFADCENLHYIEAQGNPIAIGEYAFIGCDPFLVVYGPNEDCALRTEIRNSGYRYNAYTLTLETPLRTITRIYDAGSELMLPTNPETAENQFFTGWYTGYDTEDLFTGTVMPAEDLTLYAGTAKIFEYETIDDSETGEVIGICITACHAPNAEITIPDTIGDVPVIGIAADAFGATYTRVTLPANLSEIGEGAFAEGTVLVCAPGSAAEAAAQAAGYTVEARSWTLRWESGFALELESSTRGLGDAIVAPSIERSGYELAGWYYDEDHIDALTAGDVMPAHDVTLYADWNVTDEEIAQFADNLRLTFNGDTVTVTGYVGTGTVLSIPASLHGKTVTEIAPNAFAYNNAVTAIVLPDTVATVGEKAFFSMRNLSSLTLPAGLKTLPADVLNGCISLESVTLPEGLESITRGALANSGLTELSLPASLMTIDSSALRGCAALNEIQVAAGNSYFESRDGVLFDTADGILVKYPVAKTVEDYTVRDTWSIGAWAFENAQALKEVHIDAEIYSLGTGAFRNCTGLTALPELGEYVTKIPDECFYGCASLSSEVLPETVRELGRYAFANSGLKELTVSNSLIRIGAFALGSDVLLRGESGCYAETWAAENGVIFIPVGTVMVESITLPETRITLKRGERLALTPTVVPAEAGNGTLKYLSADERIVRVDEIGQLYAVGGGTTTVFVSAPGGVEASCTVTVEIVLESFRLAVEGRITGIPGESLSLGVQVKPDKLENKEIRYSSSNSSVAEVSEDGTITMLKNGAALITAIPAADETMAKSVLILCGLDNQLRLPAALTVLEADAMAGVGAEYVLLPKTIEAIEAHAFANCGSLCLAEFSNASVNLGEDVFLNCPSLTILAPAGGSVERYATDHNIPFIALESFSSDP